jgi:hypothetical protein
VHAQCISLWRLLRGASNALAQDHENGPNDAQIIRVHDGDAGSQQLGGGRQCKPAKPRMASKRLAQCQDTPGTGQLMHAFQLMFE